ncbi:ABC transporter permease subunit [Treponema sp.]
MKTNRDPFRSPYLALAFLLPAACMYLTFMIVPLIRTVFSSLFDWGGLGSASFVGFSNYLEVFTDSKFFEAAGHNILLIFFLAVIPALVGLFLATLLEMNSLKSEKLFETVYFIPQVLSLVVVGVVWKWIYHPLYGFLQGMASLLGSSTEIPLLGDSRTALIAVGISGTWVNYGFAMMVFLSGYKRIPEELYESAAMDGASRIRQWWSISLPLLIGEISVVFTYLLISALKVFDLVYVMTRGGPGTSTTVLSLYVFKNAFQYNRPSYASALAVVMSALMVLIAVLPNALRQGANDEN